MWQGFFYLYLSRRCSCSNAKVYISNW